MTTATCSRCAGTGLEPDDRAIGRRMREMRLAKGLSLKDAAARMGISPSYLSDLEQGRRRWGTRNVQRYESVLQ